MYELYPYFTNDGSVGLYSRQDDDIYHSTYGALTESWQKFILPANLEQYITEHNSVKILDICYGIGYNTKTALNVFVKKSLEVKKNSQKRLTSQAHNIEAIDADNILSQVSKKNGHEAHPDNYKNVNSNSILIDAVDLDKTLINLSPFIADASKFNFFFKKNYGISIENEFKYQQIESLRNFKKLLKKEFRIKKEVSIILLIKLLEYNPELFKDIILLTIFKYKKYNPFLNKFMLNFAKFYSNSGCNYNQKQNNSSFLHNIYYQYISKSYKNALFLLNNNEIDVNFHNNDARNFIQSTKNTYNFIFLDAFTPAKCPALWTVQFFKELYSRLEDDGMVLTYSNSAAVRNAFLQNGFFVGKIYDDKLKKFIGSIATKNESLIKCKLDERDLDLVNSKAGICFKDIDLNLDNSVIIENRKNEIKDSDLISSSKILKGYKNGNIKSL